MRRIISTCFLFSAPAICLGQASSPAGSRNVVDNGIVIEDVTLISPERQAPLLHSTVVIRDGRIAQIGKALVAGPHATRIAGRGRFLIPGLIDSHVHVGAPGPIDDDAMDAHPELLQAYRAQLPRAFLAFGFTTLVDLDLKEQTLSWFNASPLHPNLCHCGRAVHTAGGYGAFQIPKDAPEANNANIVYESSQAKDWPAALDPHDYTPARAVERAAEAGAICLKAFIEPGFGGLFHWPVPSTETLKALRVEITKRKLVFVIHANDVDTWRAALDAHADVIAHGLWYWQGDRSETVAPQAVHDVIAAAARDHVRVQPTMQVVAGEVALIDPSLLDDSRLAAALPPSVIAHLRSPEGVKSGNALLDEYRKASPSPGFEPLLKASIERTQVTFKLMLQDHVTVIFGTDTSGVDGFGNPPGLNGRLELQNWAEAGAPLSLILRAATLDNAAAFGLSKDLGSIEVGKRADLLLLRADPLKTTAAYDQIDTIFLSGNPISRESLLPKN